MQRSGVRFLAGDLSIFVSSLPMQCHRSCYILTVKWTVVSHFRISLLRRRLILLGPRLRFVITAIWTTAGFLYCVFPSGFTELNLGRQTAPLLVTALKTTAHCVVLSVPFLVPSTTMAVWDAPWKVFFCLSKSMLDAWVPGHHVLVKHLQTWCES